MSQYVYCRVPKIDFAGLSDKGGGDLFYGGMPAAMCLLPQCRLVMCKNQFDKHSTKQNRFCAMWKAKSLFGRSGDQWRGAFVAGKYRKFCSRNQKNGFAGQVRYQRLLPERLNRLLEQKQLTMWRWIIKIVINIGMIQWGCIKAKSKNQIK